MKMFEGVFGAIFTQPSTQTILKLFLPYNKINTELNIVFGVCFPSPFLPSIQPENFTEEIK